MALVQNFNVNPYYDDYDEDKQFLRMLFRPGYSVQARELTQLQTILQKQIERFGNSIYLNGSKVNGAEVSFDTTVVYHKLQTTTVGGNPIDVNNFLGKSIGNAHALASNGSLGKVIAVSEAEGGDPPTIYVAYATALTLTDDETFFTIDDDLFEARTISSNSKGKSSIAYISEGVMYVDGFFVKVLSQTLILDKYTNESNYRVGLQYDELIVEESSDTSLLDPALEASNYQAPGATRYKVTLTLSKRTLNSVDDSKFFELKRIEQGTTTFTQSDPLYSTILDFMAARTYDESGNYTVEPFKIYMKDHVPEQFGQSANNQLITAKLSDGKAYIRGYSVSTQSPINLPIERARTTEFINNYDVNSRYGNYVVVANTKGLFDVSTMAVYDAHIVDASNITVSNTTTYNSTKIGTLRVREIEYDSAANTRLANTYSHKLYVFDTRFTGLSNNAVSATTNTIVLAGNGFSSPVSNAYYNATIRISSGTGADNVKHRIINYVPATRTATIDGTFAVTPTTASIYTIDYNVKDLESITKVNVAGSIIASANISTVSKINSTVLGDTYFSDTDDKTLVFRIPQSFIAFGMSDQDFRGKYSFKNVPVSTGIANFSTSAISSGGTLSDLNFIGSGALSDSDKLEHFIVTANTMGSATDFVNGQVIPLVDATGRSVTISPSTDAQINFATANSFTIDIVASVDFNTTIPKSKTLLTANTTQIGTSFSQIGNTKVYTSFGQVAISTPNKTPGVSDSLYISDIFKLEGKFEETYGYFNVVSGSTTKKSSFKVIDSGNTQVAVVAADFNESSKDITSRYILNDGQKDEYYDHGSITLRPGVPPPVGQILVLFNYFTHGSSLGYFTLDSYNVVSLGASTDERYAKIPNFTSPTSGQVYKLRDCVDFRPRRQDVSTALPNFTLSNIQIPKNGESLESDFSYYLPRIDRVVLREDKKFEVIKGVPSINPQTPKEPENVMSLYTITVNPFTFFPSDTKVRYIENKRYTMKDIGKLEKRINNLEYYTALNTLEKSAQDLTILDSNGLERFKNGILVDSFRGHQVGDVTNNDYKCSINAKAGELRPSFTQTSYEFRANASSTTSNVHVNQIITSPYTIESLLTQNVATKVLAVNPFTLTNYSGTLEFFPPGDFWIDTNTRPDVLVNLEGENDAWERIGQALNDTRAPGWEQVWDPWQDFAGTYEENLTTTTKDRSVGYLDYQDTVAQTYGVQFYSKERYGTQNVLVPERVTADIGKRQVDLSVIPYIRPQFIMARATGLRPNEYHYLFAEQGDLDGTKYIEYPSIAWLYNINGLFDDTYGVYETVTSSSGGTARLIKRAGRTWSLEQGHVFLVDVRGNWNFGDTITGSVSGATGSIDVMFFNNGNVASASASTITLGSGSPVNNAYVNVVSSYAGVSFPETGTKVLEDPIQATEFYKVRIISGKGIGQERTIINYNGSTKVANVSPSWDVVPDNTSRWSVGKPQSDDHGEMCGRWFLPNYDSTAYDNGWKSRTGARLIRLTNNANNNPLATSSFAEDYWYAQGVLNTIENVSISVRVPTIQPKVIYEQDSNYRSESTLLDENTVGTRLVRDNTPVPDPPPPPPPPNAPAPAPAAGGGSGCKIICAEMASLGFFEDDVNAADQRFGRRLQKRHPKLYAGYVYWARTIVSWLRGEGPSLYLWNMNDNNTLQTNIATHMTEVLAGPWAEEMARIEGVRSESSMQGKIIFWIGLIICAIVGIFKPNLNKPDSRLKGYTIFTVMLFFYIVFSIVNIIISPFKMFTEIFKNKLIRN